MPSFAVLKKIKIDGEIKAPPQTVELTAARGAWLIKQGFPLKAPPGFSALTTPKPAGARRRCCGG